ncbi:hypothetical protein KN1_00430 [Stygiolobus caldivivus]|uniref:Uncharacterized protein n=1 Tax=Stygiolobus caldivivus TaxID=2824673 RepID=A0A8D5ZHI6_9CREN|nr:hypothetical protein KN1_00430 [Stygiolobus caldivivus]
MTSSIIITIRIEISKNPTIIRIILLLILLSIDNALSFALADQNMVTRGITQQ